MDWTLLGKYFAMFGFQKLLKDLSKDIE